MAKESNKSSKPKIANTPANKVVMFIIYAVSIFLAILSIML